MIDSFAQMKLSQSHNNFANSKTENCFVVISNFSLEIDERFINRFTRAAYEGDVSLVNDMLDVGVPVDGVVGLGHTALKYAAWMNRTDVTLALLKRGANVDKQGGSLHSTALHRAALCNNTNVIKVLLKHGASTNIKDCYGDTPIDRARAWNNEAAVGLLEQH